MGLFTLLGLILIGMISVYVNNKPFWWRPCQFVHIDVEDATGLKPKTPVRSLGLEIGYLKGIELSETHVRLWICVTASVEMLPTTRAYMRAEGFMGDKFVELKPVKYIGPSTTGNKPTSRNEKAHTPFVPYAMSKITDVLFTNARAADQGNIIDDGSGKERKSSSREIQVGAQSQDFQQVVTRVDSLIKEVTNLTTDLKQALSPEELHKTMLQINRTLENASKTLSPEGGLNQTAQRTLAKLEDAIEQLRAMMTRVNQGQGSIGMLLNDPSYANEIKETLHSANQLLSKATRIRFVVDVGGEDITTYQGGRGWFKLNIWPKPDRYYLLGMAVDPRGRLTQMVTTTQVAGTSTTINTSQVEETGLLITGMMGKIFFERLDLSIGALNGDGAVGIKLNLGPKSMGIETIQVEDYLYSRSGAGIDNRINLVLRPFLGVYLRAGLESINTHNGTLPISYGAGVSFDDEDIKLLFAFK